MKEKEIIRKYLGIPYKHMGRSADALDCWGLIKAIYADRGLDIYDLNGSYESEWSKNGKNYFLENYYKDWDKVITPQFLDVILINSAQHVACHAGVFLSYSKFIHCTKVGVLVSKLSSSAWKNRIEGFYRLKALQL